MSQTDRLLRAAKGLAVERPPMWVMRQAGRYLPEYNQAKGDRDFFAVCRTPSLAATITLQPLHRFARLDAAIIFSDILVIPQALGMVVEMIEKKGPSFPEPLQTPADLEKLNKKPDVVTELGYVYEAIKEVRRRLASGGEEGSGRPLIGFAGAPWTLMAYMIEGGGSKTFQKSKEWLYRWPEESKTLLGWITDAVVEFLARQVEAGAQLVQVFDSNAGELSPTCFAEFSLPTLHAISSRLPARLRELGIEPVPMTVFAKGAWYALDALCDSGYNVVGLDWTHDPAEAVKIARGRVTLQGNLDPNVLYGGREAITREVERMVRGFWQGGEGWKGWICNLGHGITPGVDPENLGWFFEEVERVCKEVEAGK